MILKQYNFADQICITTKLYNLSTMRVTTRHKIMRVPSLNAGWSSCRGYQTLSLTVLKLQSVHMKLLIQEEERHTDSDYAYKFEMLRAVKKKEIKRF
jgi:hypothetical protein